MIPTYNKIIVHKKGIASDGWGGKVSLEPVEYKCRIVEGTRSLKMVSTEEDVRNVRNREIVNYAKVFIPGIVDITQDDDIEFINELGKSNIYVPISIGFIRNISGRPIYTVVEVGGK
jgi:hypothetical protein